MVVFFRPWLRRIPLFFALLFGIALTAPVADAQPTRGRRGPADVALQAGAQSAKIGDWATAVAEYTRANALKPSAEAIEGVANAEYRLGNFAEAYEAYDALVKTYGARGAPITRLAELTTKTGMISVRVLEPGNAVTIDDRRIGTSPLSAHVRVTAGTHRIRVTRDGYAPSEQNTLVSAEGAVVVDVPPLVAATATAVAAPTTVATAPTTPVAGPHGLAEWEKPHPSKTYAPMRAVTPPTIDGVLDEKLWLDAPRDNRFFSTKSKPYGQPATEPTIVQVAYDETYLYVAFRCSYSSSRQRDDGVPADESKLVVESEGVGVAVDSLLDHTNARFFVVGRTGGRADVELSDGGSNPNPDVRAIWDSATKREKDSWTAELKIPWGTLGLPAHGGPFEVGVNFRRREPISGEYGIWALHPPATPIWDTNFFGHLTGMSDVHPSQRLFILPYVAGAYTQDAVAPGSRLSDFVGGGRNATLYGGFYARYRPPGPFQIDMTMNPDFSAIDPDAAIANVDRFELVFDETRPFFSEDAPRFSFGDYGAASLFYSRRVGLKTNPDGTTSVVPIIYGAKAVVRSEGTEAGIMNVELSTPNPKVTFADNISVARINHSFGLGRRIGTMLLAREGAAPSYMATGIDGAYSVFDEHLMLSGFFARSVTSGAGGGPTGEGSLSWASEDYNASVTYLDISKDFDGQLGFFPLTGVRSTIFTAAYTPVLRNDLVRQVLLETSLNRTKNQDYTPVYDRVVLGATALFLNSGSVSVKVLPSVEEVAQDFKIAGNRLTIPKGHYDVLATQFTASTAPRAHVVGSLGYLEGDLFGGYRRVPSVGMKLNLGPYAGTVLYQLFLFHYGTQDLTGHQVSLRSTYAYTPLARTTLAIEANSLTLRAVTRLVTTYTFGTLSTVSLALTETTGANLLNPSDTVWYSNPNFTAILSFAYGFTPF